MLLRAGVGADRASADRDSGGRAGWVRLQPDLRRLPFASAAFDVVVSAYMLEHVAEPPSVLRKCMQSRWNGYHAYLRASLQRHRSRLWRAASRLAGLRPVLCPADGALSPLRLLASCCVDESLADEGGSRQ